MRIRSVLGLCALMGCGSDTDPSAVMRALVAPVDVAKTAPAPLTQAALAGGAVQIVPPKGYCIDPQTLDTRRIGGFALIASCRHLSEGGEGTVVATLLMTATVMPMGTPTRLPEAAEIAAGAGADLLDQETDETMVLARLGAAETTPQTKSHWRGVTRVNGRLVGLALYAPDGSSHTGDRGKALLRTLAEGMSPQDGDTPQGPGLAGLLGRVLGQNG